MNDLEALYAQYGGFPDAIVADLHPVVIHYIECRNAGTSPSLSEQFALATTPTIKGTDAQLWAGWGGVDQFNSTTRKGKILDDAYRGPAHAAGVSTTGRKYLHSVARYPGDPQAWIADSHDIRRIAEEQNLGVTGFVERKREEREPTA